MQQNTLKPEGCDCKDRPKILSDIGVFISFIVVFLATYLPLIRINYLYMEDYVFINPPQPPSFFTNIIERSVAGKFGYGIFVYLISNYFRSDILIRFIGIISMGLLAYVIYKMLKMYRVRPEHAFFAGVLACTLPSAQIHLAWTTTVPYLYSAIISFAAGMFLFKSMSRGKRFRALPYFFTIVLLVAAMQIYPPTAMLYWTAGIIPLLSLRDEDFTEKWSRPFIIYISAGLASSAVYFFTIKVLHFFMNIGFPGRGGLLELTSIPLKLKWFFCCPLNYTLNLWSIFPTYGFAGVVGIIIAGMFLLKLLKALKKEDKMGLLWSHSQRLLLVIAVLFLSYLPNLVIVDTVPAYRTLVALAMVTSLLFYFGLANTLDIFRFPPQIKDSVLTILLIILSLVSSYHAYHNVQDFAILQANDYKYVKNAISEYGISKLSGDSEIYVRRIEEERIRAKGFLTDEFGISTTSHPWGPPNVIRTALHELGGNLNVKIDQGKFDDPVPEGENILVIDMTKFDYLIKYDTAITDSQRYCRTIPNRL